MKTLLLAFMLALSPMTFAATEITDATAAQIDKEYKAGAVVVVKFYAPWCPACKAYAPTFEAAEKKFGSKVKFYAVDVDKSPRMGAAVPFIPLTVVSQGGKGEALPGAVDAKTLESNIQKVLDRKAQKDREEKALKRMEMTPKDK